MKSAELVEQKSNALVYFHCLATHTHLITGGTEKGVEGMAKTDMSLQETQKKSLVPAGPRGGMHFTDQEVRRLKAAQAASSSKEESQLRRAVPSPHSLEERNRGSQSLKGKMEEKGVSLPLAQS